MTYYAFHTVNGQMLAHTATPEAALSIAMQELKNLDFVEVVASDSAFPDYAPLHECRTRGKTVFRGGGYEPRFPAIPLQA